MVLAAVGVGAGVVLHEVLPAVGWGWTAALSALMVALLCIERRLSRTSSTLFSIQLLLTFCVLGLLLATVRTPEADRYHYSHFVSDAPCAVAVRVVSPAHLRNGYVQFECCVRQWCDADGCRPARGRLLVRAKGDSIACLLHRGERLWLVGRLSEPFAPTNPYQFDYRRYLRHKEITHVLRVAPSGLMPDEAGHDGLVALLDRWRSRCMAAVERTPLSPSQQGVAEALLLGWRDHMDDDTYAHYRDAGIAHLLCVSGLHVGIVAGLLALPGRFCGRSRRGRRWAAGLQTTGLWLFVLLTGAAPSALRAGLMFTLLILGRHVSASTHPVNSLAASALVLLLMRPGVLFEAGFQLSYAAVAGILLLGCPLRDLWCPRWRAPWGWLARNGWELLCVTLAAQLFTMPFLALYFHRLSAYFFIAGLLVVPFAGVLMGSVMLLLACSWCPPLLRVMAAAVGAELRAVDRLTQWVSTLPGANPTGLFCDPAVVVLFLLASLLLARAVSRRSWATLLGSVAVWGLVVGYGTWHRCVSERGRDLVVYDVRPGGAIELMEGRQSVLLCDSLTAQRLDRQGRTTFVAQRGVRRTTLLPQGGSTTVGGMVCRGAVVQVDTVRMVIVDRRWAHLRSAATDGQPTGRLRCHYLLVTQDARIPMPVLQRCFQFDTLVVGADCTRRTAERYVAACAEGGIPCHAVPLHGALHRHWRR